jgi:hypothetical protein
MPERTLKTILRKISSELKCLKYKVPKIRISVDQDIRMQVISESGNQEKTNLCCAVILITWYPDPGAPGLPGNLMV